jgi:hypothetical protein
MAIRTVRLIDTIPRPAKSSGLRAAVMIASALVANMGPSKLGLSVVVFGGPGVGCHTKGEG